MIGALLIQAGVYVLKLVVENFVSEAIKKKFSQMKIKYMKK